jgi:hypothetical protein
MRSLGRIASAIAGLFFALGTGGCLIIADHVHAGDFVDAHFWLTWSLEDAWTGRSIDCYGAGADTVRVVADNLDTGETFVDVFDCVDHEGRSAEVSAGDYAVDVDLLDCGGDPDCDHAVWLDGYRLDDVYGVYHGGDYDLGHFVFAVDRPLH